MDNVLLLLRDRVSYETRQNVVRFDSLPPLRPSPYLCGLEISAGVRSVSSFWNEVLSSSCRLD